MIFSAQTDILETSFKDYNMAYRLKKIFLLAGDFAILNLALFLTLVIRYPRSLRAESWQNHWPSFLVIFVIWLLILYINDLYNLNLKTGSRQFFRLTINAVLAASLLSIFYFYLNVQSAITPKTNLAIFIALFVALFLIWRGLFRLTVLSFIPENNLAIIGFNDPARKLLAELKRNPGAGYQTALIFKSSEEIAALPASIKEKNIHTVVVCDDFGQSEKLREALFGCLPYNLTFFDYPDLYELLTGKVPMEAISQSWFLEKLKEGEKNYFNFCKRIVDFLAALLILIISLPAWPIIALGIKLSGRGPVLFRQTRVGRNEKNFEIIKFRTMRTENNNLAPTEEEDGRITSFGSFLRKTRLDEIPQAINILKGEMSFIGPRPERPEIVSELERQIPFYKTRLLIKPGLTGWDQVSGHYHSPSTDDSLEKLQHDLYYLKQRSFYLDFAITLKTLATMMSRSGR